MDFLYGKEVVSIYLWDRKAVLFTYSIVHEDRAKLNEVRLFADDMVLYIKNPKDSTRKLLELINAIVKMQDIKVTHKNPLHFYTLTMKKQIEKLRKQFHSSLQ